MAHVHAPNTRQHVHDQDDHRRWLADSRAWRIEQRRMLAAMRRIEADLLEHEAELLKHEMDLAAHQATLSREEPHIRGPGATAMDRSSVEQDHVEKSHTQLMQSHEIARAKHAAVCGKLQSVLTGAGEPGARPCSFPEQKRAGSRPSEVWLG